MSLLLCDIGAGWFSGMVAVIVGHPFDTIKVRQQVLNISAPKACRGLIQDGGLKGFYRGLLFPLIANGILNSAFFAVYGPLTESFAYSRIAARHANENKSGLLKAEAGSFTSTYPEIFLAGAISGVFQTFIATPIDLIKIKLQAARKSDINYYVGPFDAVRGIYKTAGFKGFFQGFWTMLYREIPGCAVWITSYEILKKEIPCPSGCSENFKNLISGGLAGILCWSAIMPLDVVKSKLQADSLDKPQFRGIMHCTSEVWKEKGIIGFYRGFWSASARAFPVNAASLLAYDLIMNECRGVN